MLTATCGLIGLPVAALSLCVCVSFIDCTVVLAGGDDAGTFKANFGGGGGDQSQHSVESQQECCAVCLADTACTVAVYDGKGTCHIKSLTKPGYTKPGYWWCQARTQLQ